MLVDVSIPKIGIDSLTYETDTRLETGVRVIVEVLRTKYAGFVLGESRKNLPPGVKAKPVEGVIDERRIVDRDIWELAMWAGKITMCGMSKALRASLPVQLLTGEKLLPPPKDESSSARFTERNFFNPFDTERVNFFLAELDSDLRTLILFPKKEDAKSFFMNLPESLKAQSVLWSSENPKFFETWKMIHSRKFRVVIAPPGGVFAPLMPEKIIVEDESSPAYVIPYTLNLSARSLAGQRANILGAEFITAGRIPSLKTFIRKKPREILKPERKNIILADIHRSRKEDLPGIEGNIPLTYTLTSRTHKELADGHNVIWILNRTGESSEVFCSNCGESVKCPKCGGIMQARNDGDILKCKRCGMIRNLPELCEKCGFHLLVGKRPGIEALAKIAGKYFHDIHIFTDGVKLSDLHGLIISTSKGLGLLSEIDTSLVAWLDLDSELWRMNHDNRYNVYSMLCESYWRGRTYDSNRNVLIQTRRKGLMLAEFLSRGWEKFIPEELKMRREFMLPPYGYIVEIETNMKKLRDDIINLLMDAGFFVMDPGDDSKPFYVNCESLEAVRKSLEPEKFIRNTKTQFINITVRSD